MHVTILNGSARGERKTTGKLVEAFTKGLVASGAVVKSFVIHGMNISYCTACLSCMHMNPGKCVIEDGMAEIYESLKNSDMLVLATPVYVDSMSAQLKTVMDRCICSMKPFLGKDGTGRIRHPFTWNLPSKFFLVATSGFPETETFIPLVQTFRAMASNFSATPIGEICIPGSIALQMEPERLEGHLVLLEKAGSLIGEKGDVPDTLLQEINRPPLDIEEYLAIADKYESWCKERLNQCRVSAKGFAD